MKKATLIILTVLAFTATTWGQPRPTNAPTAAATTTVPPSKIAVVYTGQFSDEKEGIAKFVAAYRQLNTEFGPKQTELGMLGKRIQTLSEEVNKLRDANASANAKVIQTKIDEHDRLRRELEFKKKDAENAYQKRESQLLQPIIAEVRQALQAFAAAEGITMILDGDKMTDNLLMMTPAMDVTKVFIKYFNQKFPR